MKREHQESSGGGGGSGYSVAAPLPMVAGGEKGKMAEMEEEAGVDELLAALGYKVRSSDMADVAQKLEQLEMAMVSSSAQDDALLAHLASDTVHYNPSDLSTWLESMLSELNAPPPPLPPTGAHFDLPSHSAPSGVDPSPVLDPAESSTITSVDFVPNGARASSGYDLKPIPNPGPVAFPSDPTTAEPRDRKRMRPSSSSSSSSRGGVGIGPEVGAASSPAAALPVVVVDSQEAGICLVHTLMACAEAVAAENLATAGALVKQVSVLAASQGGAMRKVASYFAEALAHRIYRLTPTAPEPALADLLHAHFYESAPYLKFAHFTANQAILEAFAGCRRVHVIDFGMKQGMQWPALLQALALRAGGPPSFRLTGIGPPQPDNSDALQQVGWKLAQLADSIRVDFQYRGFVAGSLADLEPFMLQPNSSSGAGDDDESEAIAVNSVLELHRLLARPGSVEKVLATVKALKPRIVTVVEQEANHNAGPFLERFTEALHYYSTMFDSLEGGGTGAAPEAVAVAVAGAGAGGGSSQDHVMSEAYLGRQICNVVACEGPDRTERHETLSQWRNRLTRAGLEPVHLGSNAFKQASMLLALFAGGDGYRVEEKEGCLTLGWHTRPLIATSAWRVAGTGDR